MLLDGIVITFVNIDTLMDIERLSRSIKQETRLATVMRDANDAITVQSFDGTISAWNLAATRMYGYSEEEALGMHIWKLIPEDYLVRHQQMTAALQCGSNAPYQETVRITKNGDLVRVGFTATALVNRNETPYAIATTERLL